MAYSDMELAYLLTAYGKKVYALALQRTNHMQHAEAILQEVFLELVNFPPALEGEQEMEGWLLKRAEKCAKAYPKDLTHVALQEPLSEAAEDELLALMKEARDHEGILKRPLKKWRAFHTVLAGALSLALVSTILLAALLGGGGKTYSDEQGSADGLLTAPSTDQKEDLEDPPSKEEEPDLPPMKKDPLPPKIINDNTCATYTSLREFVGALEDKATAGYGKTYYNTRALLLLPSRLPDGAVFRCLYLYPQSGSYAYSFRFEYQKTLYLLEFDVKADLPATAMEVGEFIAAIRDEKTTRAVKGTTLTATFGKDRVTATLSTPKSKEPIDPKLAKKLFSAVTLERCSPENPFLK